MIKLINVTKIYRYKKTNHYVFKDFSFEFPKMINVGVIGPNGAGKTTLLRLLGGVEDPNYGTITREGSVSWQVGLTQAAQGALSASDNIKTICKFFGKSMDETKKVIAFVKNFAEIGKHFNMPLNTYSSGMKARVNFGLSMAFDFDYYLVDEVTSVGDADFRKKASNAFHEKKKKAAIILVSHSMSKIKEHCDVILYINNGYVKYFENVEEGIEEYYKTNKRPSLADLVL